VQACQTLWKVYRTTDIILASIAGLQKQSSKLRAFKRKYFWSKPPASNMGSRLLPPRTASHRLGLVDPAADSFLLSPLSFSYTAPPSIGYQFSDMGLSKSWHTMETSSIGPSHSSWCVETDFRFRQDRDDSLDSAFSLSEKIGKWSPQPPIMARVLHKWSNVPFVWSTHYLKVHRQYRNHSAVVQRNARSRTGSVCLMISGSAIGVKEERVLPIKRIRSNGRSCDEPREECGRGAPDAGPSLLRVVLTEYQPGVL